MICENAELRVRCTYQVLRLWLRSRVSEPFVGNKIHVRTYGTIELPLNHHDNHPNLVIVQKLLLFPFTSMPPHTNPSVLAFITDQPPPRIEPVPLHAFRPWVWRLNSLTTRPADHQFRLSKISYLNYVCTCFLFLTVAAHCARTWFIISSGKITNAWP